MSLWGPSGQRLGWSDLPTAGAVSSWDPGLLSLGWACPLGTVWLEASRSCDASASPVWTERFVWCCARERIHGSCEERCGRKRGNICQDFSLLTAPHLIAGAGTSPTFSFPLAPKLLKVKTVIQKSNQVQIFKDGACYIQGWCLFIQLVYISFHDNLVLSLTAYFVCFLVSDWLVDNWWEEFLTCLSRVGLVAS